jgi:hypothetical protein
MKTWKTLSIAAVLAAAPTLALAYECNSSKQISMSCATGLVWDSVSRSCVTSVNS